MGHATGQAVKRNGKPCTVLTRLYSVQNIRNWAPFSFSVPVVILSRKSGWRLWWSLGYFILSVTSQIMHILSDALALNNTACDLFFFYLDQTMPCTVLSLFPSYRQQLPPLLCELNITCFRCNIQPPSDENGYAEIHLHVLIACLTIVESFAM